MRTFLLLSAFSLFAYSAQAEEPSPEFFTNFTQNNTDYRDTVRIKTENMFRLTFPKCIDNIEMSAPKETLLLQPIEARQSEEILTQDPIESDDDITPTPNKISITDEQPTPPIYGQWIVRVLTKGCGEQTVINHLAVAYTDKQPILLPVINGKTILDPIDQPFAEAAIAERLLKLERPCDLPALVKNSAVIGYRSENGSSIVTKDIGYGWFEKWSINACDIDYDANVAILPDPKTRYAYLARLHKKP